MVPPFAGSLTQEVEFYRVILLRRDRGEDPEKEREPMRRGRHRAKLDHGGNDVSRGE